MYVILSALTHIIPYYKKICMKFSTRLFEFCQTGIMSVVFLTKTYSKKKTNEEKELVNLPSE